MWDLDPEQDARLRGLMATLALPPRRGLDGVDRRVLVEVEIAHGRWMPVDALAIEPGRLLLWHGVNGHCVEYAFVRGESVPRWRTRTEPKVCVWGAR